MKKLATFLNLTLCLELVLMPLNQSLITSRPAQANTCSTGQQWDANLGRCLTDVETAKVMQATASCDAKDVECYKKNAQEAFDKKVADGEASPEAKKNNGFVSKIRSAGAVAAAILSISQWMKNGASRCAAISHSMIIAGGVTTFAGEFFANSKHKKNLKKLEKEWETIVNTGYDGSTDKDSQKAHATAAQSEAFEIMARVEDSIADNAKTKRKIHTAVTAMYAAAGVAAGIEVLSKQTGAGWAATACPAKKASFIPTRNIPKNEYQLFVSFDPNDDWEFYLLSNYKKNYLLSNAVKDDFDSIFTLFQSDDHQFSSPSTDQYLASKDIQIDKASRHTMKEILKTIIINLNPFLSAQANDALFNSIEKSQNMNDTLNIQVTTRPVATPTAAPTIAPPVEAPVSVIEQPLHDPMDNIAKPTEIQGKQDKEKFMESPEARLLFSAVLAGLSFTMIKHTKSQEEASRNRAEVLRKMKRDFEGASAEINMCTPEDRSNTNKPECYCYTAEGTRNPNRGSSQICQKLWNGSLAGKNDYKDKSNAFSGCIDNSNNYDQNCACKKTSKGCMNVKISGLGNLPQGTFSMLNSGISPINDIASGEFAKATASDAANLNNAIRNMKALDKMLDQPAIKKHIPNKNKTLEGIETSLAKGSRGTQYNDGLARGFTGNAGQSIASLTKELEDKLPKSQTSSTSANKTLSGGASKKASSFDFDFGEEQKAIDAQVSNVMDQNFDYAQNDINNQSHTNIFEVLSNRYQRSGLRRLFDEEGESPVEAASSTDISP